VLRECELAQGCVQNLVLVLAVSGSRMFVAYQVSELVVDSVQLLGCCNNSNEYSSSMKAVIFLPSWVIMNFSRQTLLGS
jgi:hypothetical protein